MAETTSMTDQIGLLKMLTSGRDQYTAHREALKAPTAGEELSGGLVAATQDIPQNTFAGGLVKGLAQGYDVMEKKKGASKRERLQEYILDQERYANEENKRAEKIIRNFQTEKAAAEEVQSLAPQVIDAFSTYESTQDMTKINEITRVMQNSSELLRLWSGAPDGARFVQYSPATNAQGESVLHPVFVLPDGDTFIAPQGKTYNEIKLKVARPLSDAQAMRSTQMNEEQKAAAELQKTRADTLRSLADAGMVQAAPQQSPQGGTVADLVVPMPMMTKPKAKDDKAPSGYRFKEDGSLEPIPGGPAFNKNEMLSEKQMAAQNAGISQADRLITKVDQALGNTNTLTSGFFEGIQPDFIRRATGATDLQADLETIKANLGFAELQAMREASPTGGALGQVAVQELTALQSTIASLDQAQNPEQLKQRLGEIRKHYESWKNAVVQSRQQGGQNTPQATPDLASMSDEELEALAGGAR